MFDLWYNVNCDRQSEYTTSAWAKLIWAAAVDAVLKETGERFDASTIPSSKEVVTDKRMVFRYDIENAPRRKKMIILTDGGVALMGQLTGNPDIDRDIVGWYPIPVRDRTLEQRRTSNGQLDECVSEQGQREQHSIGDLHAGRGTPDRPSR